MSHHQWTQEHLAWYINDTLVGEEHARVHQHLNECVLCRQEYKQLKHLSNHVSAETDIPLNSAAALAELQPQLSGASNTGIFSGVLAVLRQTPVTVRYVLAIQCAALILLAGFAIDPNIDSQAVTGYTTLSNASESAGDLRIVFNTQLTASQREELLQSYELELVGNVSTRGIATVKWSDVKQQETIKSLRNHEAIVMVEPIGVAVE